jgi:hypothetical protein
MSRYTLFNHPKERPSSFTATKMVSRLFGAVAEGSSQKSNQLRTNGTVRILTMLS